MTDARRIVEDAEARLAPLSVDVNLAWWDSQVEATEENAERRDARRARVVGRARRPRAVRTPCVRLARRVRAATFAAASTSSTTSCSGTSCPTTSGRGSSSSRPRSTCASRATAGVVGGVEVGDTEIKRILRQSDDSGERREAWEASKTVGARSSPTTSASSRGSATRPRAALGHRDWFALSLVDRRARRGEAHRHARRGRSRRPPSRSRAGRRALDERLAARFGCAVADLRPWHYADPFFQETPPDGAVDLDPLFDGRGRRRARAAHARGRRARGGRRSSARSDLYPRDGKNQHAFCIDIDRARRRPHPREPRADARLGGHDAPRARSRRLRPRLPGRPPVASPLDASRRDGGVGAPVRRARRGGASGSSASSALSSHEVAELEPRLARRAGRRAPRLHALGARDEHVRARAVRESRRRPRHALVGARLALPGGHAARRTPRAGLGREDPHRRLAGLLPHLSLRGDRRRCSSRPRSSRRPAGSSIDRRPARCSASGSSPRGSRSAGTASSSRRPALRCRSSRSSAPSQAA